MTLKLGIDTEYSADRGEKSKKFSRNYVDYFSREKINCGRKSATSQTEIHDFVLWPSIYGHQLDRRGNNFFERNFYDATPRYECKHF